MKLKLLGVVLSVAGAVFTAYKGENPKVEAVKKAVPVVKKVVERVTQTRHVAVPNDANDWYLIFHRHNVPTAADRQLMRIFRQDPRLHALWNDPRVKSYEVHRSMRGFARQSYADLPPHSLLLMDGAGERIFLRRGDNVPSSASELVRAINQDIAFYHQKHQPEGPVAATDLGPLGEPQECGVRKILRWPVVAVRWLIHGRQTPCPSVPHPAPVPVQPAEEPGVPLTEIPDTGEEAPSEGGYPIGMGLLGGLAALLYKFRQEIMGG